MYLTTNVDQVMALNAATGQLIWQYTPKVNFYLAVAGGGGGVPTNRGVTVVNGRVYLLTFDDQLIALQASTGEKVWSTVVADPTQGYSETSPPTYWNGLLFVGSAESDAGLRGFVAAYNAQTGKQVWRFYTVPAAGHGWVPAQGHHGGGDVWMPSTIDTTTGILYFGTGNPSPDFVNTLRPGCNQWVDATVALDARTGKFLWGHTQVCPDVWDVDSVSPPLLYTIYKNGEAIRVVAEGQKLGYVWIFDAKTGKVLAKSPALVHETIPRPFPNAKGVLNCPAVGIEYTPMAYSPLSQAVYVPALNNCDIIKAAKVSDTQKHVQGAVDSGGTLALVPKPTGTMSAVDAATGQILWHDKMPSPMVGGAVVTAGNLVFSGADDGHFYAFDARTGKILWTANLGLSFGAAPIAYEVNGTEYIAVADGGAVVSSGKTGGTLVVFKLGGAPVKPVPVVSAGLVPTNVEMPSLAGRTKINPWMYVDAKHQDVVIKLVAGAGGANSGFNFDGYANGKGNFVVPQGWKVEFELSNQQALPHSAAIAEGIKLPVTLANFGFGPTETPNAIGGIHTGVTQLMALTASSPGRYYLVCLVPGHIQSGMWDYFTVSPTANAPSIQAM